MVAEDANIVIQGLQPCPSYRHDVRGLLHIIPQVGKLVMWRSDQELPPNATVPLSGVFPTDSSHVAGTRKDHF